MRRWSAAALCALIVAAAPLGAQEVHAGASGVVYLTGIDRARDGALRLDNRAEVETIPRHDEVQEGDVAVLFFLGSGCRLWIERSGLWRCTVLQEPPRSAPQTPAALVWIERVVDAGATLLVAGGSVFEVPRQAEFTNTWEPGEAILIGDGRLLHLEHGDELVEVVRVR